MLNSLRSLSAFAATILVAFSLGCGDTESTSGNGGSGATGGGSTGDSGTIGSVLAMSGGEGHSLGLAMDGTVLGLGSNSDGQLAQGEMGVGLTMTPLEAINVDSIVSISAGGASSYFVKDDGTVTACGFNNSSGAGSGTDRLGTGIDVPRLFDATPMQISGIAKVAASSGGGLALATNGRVWGWGLNSSGELGINSTMNQVVPVELPTLDSITEIDHCGGNGMALQENGTVYYWGNNFQGQLGNGTTINAIAPQIVMGIPGNITKIACSGFHAMVLSADGKVWSMGLNVQGQLGLGTTGQNPEPPTEVANLDGIIDIDVGPEWSIALKDDGTVWAWGSNVNSTLSTATTDPNSSVPLMIPDLSNVTEVVIGSRSGYAHLNDGSWWGWGYGEFGNLGELLQPTVAFVPQRIY